MKNSTNTSERIAGFITFIESKAGSQDINAEVAKEALHHDDPHLFFEDLLNHGCIS